MSENLEIDNQSINKISKKSLLLEHINQLDEYFYNIEIGKKGELLRVLMENEELLSNSNLAKNIEVVLQYNDNPRFNSMVKKLKCNTIESYCKYILCATDLEGFCRTYTASSHDVKSLDYTRNQNGIIVLEAKDYLTVNMPFKGSCRGRWQLLSNGTEVFVKNIYSMKEAYAELVAEQIAKQMGIPYAQYDLVSMQEKQQIASPNILKDGDINFFVD